MASEHSLSEIKCDIRTDFIDIFKIRKIWKSTGYTVYKDKGMRKC